MSLISVRAHFDGISIQLDEPIELPLNTPLLVTVLAADSKDSLDADWSEVGRHALGRAFGENEPEYSAADILP